MRLKIYAFALCMISITFFNQPLLWAEATNNFDKYGGWTGIKGEATGCFHTQKIGNRWWLVTPEGNVFFATVMSGVRMSGIPDTSTEKRPYKEACLEKYPSEIMWAETSIKRLKDWGFNTIGNWSSKSVFSASKLPYLINIGIGKKAPNVIQEGFYGYFPDVFNPSFEQSFRERMEEKIRWYPKMPDDPWLIGYFLSDEPGWYGSRKRRGALTDDFIALPKDTYGKKAWRDFIAGKYKNVENLNLAWGKSFRSFDDLVSLNVIKDDNETITKDKLEFFKFIAEEFSRKIVGVLREYDKHHLILGSRPSKHYPEVVEAVGKYTDIYAMSYGHLNQGYTISPEFDRIVSEIYQSTEKPLLLGVLITAKDSGLPYGKVRTQKDRGISYWRYLRKLASNPNIVGLSWFQYFDPPRKCYDEKAANWGLVNGQDEPYEDAIELISQANNMLYAYAAGVSDFTPEFDGFLSFKKENVTEITKGPLKTVRIPIENSGFEKGRDAWRFQAWKGKSKALLDSSIRHDGERALKIEGGPDEGWDSVGVGIQSNPDFALKPGYQYKLSTWVKTEGVEYSAFVRIKVKYKSGDVTYFGTDSAYGTSEWKYFETTFSPREENEAEYLVAQLVGKGTVWFDNITLEVMAPEGTSHNNFAKIDKQELESKKQETKDIEIIKQIDIVNSGFEAGNKNWKFRTWKGRPSIGVDRWVAKTGKRSIKIQGSAEGWASVGVGVQSNPDFALKPDYQYRLSAWIKTKDVEHSAFVRIKVKYKSGDATYFGTEGIYDTGDWKYVETTFSPREENEAEYLVAQLVGKGTAWFDDISLEVIQ